VLRILKTKTFRIAAIIAVLMALYAIAGFVIAPKIVRSALLKDIPKSLDVTPTVGEIHINPFLFQVTVNDFALASTGGERLLGFQRLFIDFELSSLWHRAYSFVNIDMSSPYVSALVARDGSLNLLKLQPKAPAVAPAPKDKSEPIPPLRIGSLKVSRGLVTYEDRSRADVFAARLEPINFELREFTTGVEGGKFTFTGSSKLGERVEWHGHVSVDPVIQSDGEFQVNGLLVHTLWEYLQDRLNFVVNSGTVDLAATYKFSLQDVGAAPGATAAAAGSAPGSPMNLQVDFSKIGLSDLAVRPKDSEIDWVTVPALAVTGTTVNLATRQAHVDLVSLNGLKLVTWLEADGSFNLLKLAGAPSPAAASGAAAGPGATSTPSGASTVNATTAAPAATTAGPGASAAAAPAAASTEPATAAATAPASAATPAANAAAPTLTSTNDASAATSPPWQYDVRQFEIRDASIATEDRSAHPAVKVVLAPFSLQVNGISQDMAKPLTVTLDTRINEKGSLSVSGEVTPQPLVANVNLKLADIDLTPVQSYVAQHTAMTLLSGQLGGDAKVHYATQNNKPVVQFAGNINVEKVHTVDDALRDDFINWDRLDILGLNYSLNPDRLDIDQVVARKLYARVIIESDESINVKRVLKIPTVAATPAAGTTSNAGTASATAGASTAGATVDVNSAGGTGTVSATTAASESVAQPEVSVAKTRKVAARRGSAKARSVTASSQAAAAPQSMPISIKKIVVQASQANFADLSVQPNFSAGIQKLEGTIVGLSSKAGSRAKVDLHGAVDTFSPVSITGDVNVLGPLYTDLSMSFRNISLAVFNPYSGKFAGYNITKGKLTTELHYKVDGRKLDAQHHIVVEQLEFGDKTASKDAVSLPVKLAVSLLKDRNGVIDLDIPVTGSLDDPKFRLAPIIWKVFVNLLEKAVTAPFALLGSLFGGGPDIQFIDFQPGVSTLDAAATEKVKSVAKALLERPQLKIEVPLGVVPDIDRPALVDAQFKAHLAAAQGAKGSPKKAAASAGGPAPPFEQLDPATQLELLTRLYAKDLGAEPKFPDAVTSLKSKPEVTAAKIDFLDKALHDHIVIGDSELQTLGRDRATVLQMVLLSDPQVVAERVFLVANDKATAKDGAVRLELSLQ
jgi:Domain of Unknown Function (DUF748)